MPIKLVEKRSFITLKPPITTSNRDNIIKLHCSDFSYFPTYNGIDPLDEIKCIDGEWSLPDDMMPIQCKSATCPTFPDFGKKIETRCKRRDEFCLTAGKYDNVDDCSCISAYSTCKPRFITSYNKTFHEVEPPRIRALSLLSGIRVIPRTG